MGTYSVVVDVSNLSPLRRRTVARRIKAVLRLHRPFIRRTGNLRRKAFVAVWDDPPILVAGDRAIYASYLVKKKNFVEDAVLLVLPNARIIEQG